MRLHRIQAKIRNWEASDPLKISDEKMEGMYFRHHTCQTYQTHQTNTVMWRDKDDSVNVLVNSLYKHKPPRDSHVQLRLTKCRKSRQKACGLLWSPAWFDHVRPCSARLGYVRTFKFRDFLWMTARCYWGLLLRIDSVVIAGTESGKTIPFMLLPMLHPTKMVLIVSPLKVLQKDQVSLATF